MNIFPVQFFNVIPLQYFISSHLISSHFILFAADCVVVRVPYSPSRRTAQVREQEQDPAEGSRYEQVQGSTGTRSSTRTTQTQATSSYVLEEEDEGGDGGGDVEAPEVDEGQREVPPTF